MNKFFSGIISKFKKKTNVKLSVLIILIFLAILIPLVVEYEVLIPGGKHGDWLNFWAQYLGTWIALTGSSLIAVLVATWEIRANRNTEIRMFQIKERFQQVFLLLDLIQDIMFQFEYPVFRKTKIKDMNPELWDLFVSQMEEKQTFFSEVGLKANRFKYKLPREISDDFFELFGEKSQMITIEKEIQKDFESLKKELNKVAKNQCASSELVMRINSQIVEINKKHKKIREILHGFGEGCQKYLDKLEKN
ncbi:hypothetical protein [Levilactobacillus brevis]|uniref:hypothetical protein n=1 Tax=Levilactobacillus brevis TaxID=1580 RepID=UPI0020748FF3|nr:hypothetical protein [Levilactobacillus brevis]